MRSSVLVARSSLLLLIGVVHVQAQSADKGPVVQNSQAIASADQDGTKLMNIRQQIQDQMTKVGYTDVSEPV